MSAKRTAVKIGVGMPAWIYLNDFGLIIYEAFGSYPFLVGSATIGKKWRDVDVRLILEDKEYADKIGKVERPEMLNGRWRAFNMAFSELGRRITGLPIDFQIQQMSDANKLYPGEIRCALILSSRIINDEKA